MTTHTPMTSSGSTVFLAGGVCSFSVAGCPDSTGLAALIAKACTTHQQLVDALHACFIAMRADLPPGVTIDERANARAALAAAGVTV